jgi:chromosome segregation ATPase
MDTEEGGRWMTYTELAEARGIDRQSATKLAFWRHWSRQKDNHGTVRVCVPGEWAEPQRGPRDVSLDTSRDMSMDMSIIIKPLEDAVALLREQFGHAEERARAAESRADQALAELREERVAHEATRARADTETERARRAEDTAAALRREADELHARLTAAEAGNVADRERADTEVERARQARADLQAERAGHDATRATVVDHQAARQAAEDAAAQLRWEVNKLQGRSGKAEARADAENKRAEALSATLEQANREAAERGRSLLRRLQWALARR